MSFFIGRGFAERQILKMWKWPCLLNWVEYFDKLLRKHWYWQGLAKEISKWHFHWSRLCRAPNSEKEIMTPSLELSGILWWNFATHWYWQGVPHEIVKWHLRLVETLPRFKFWKKVRLLQNDSYHRLRLCRAPNSEKVKIALSWTEWDILINLFVNIYIDKI